jgi:hypothetical protein
VPAVERHRCQHRHLTAARWQGGRARGAALAAAAGAHVYIAVFTWQFSVTSRRIRQRTAGVTASSRPARLARLPWPAPPSGNRRGRIPPAPGRWRAPPPPCKQWQCCREGEAASSQSRSLHSNSCACRHAQPLHCTAMQRCIASLALHSLHSPAQPSSSPLCSSSCCCTCRCLLCRPSLQPRVRVVG